MCGSMADIQSPTAEIRRGIKKKEEERNNFLHRSRQKVPTLYNGDHFLPKLPLLMAGSGAHLIQDSPGPSEHITQTASR